MKLLAPITALIAAASAGQIYTGQSAEGYAQSAEQYQSGLEYQQRGLYSHQSQAPQVFEGHESTYSSRPTGEKTAKILAYDMQNDGHQYKYAYETENGIKAQEAGQTSEHGTVAHGAYSYTGDDGHTYTVTYTADENGFHPQGDHLPTPPPVPEAILKSLEQNARDEAAGIYDDGKYKEHASQGEDQGYQHYEANYQPHGFQASGHDSGAELAYNAHATPAPMSHAISGHGISSHVQTGHGLSSHGYSSGQAHSGHSSGVELAYHAQPIHVSSGHTSGADLAYRAHSGYLHSGHSLAPEMAYHGHH